MNKNRFNNFLIIFCIIFSIGCENLLQNNDEVFIDSQELDFFSISIEEDISLSSQSTKKLRRGISEYGEKDISKEEREPGFLWNLAVELQSTLSYEEKAEIFSSMEQKDLKKDGPRKKHEKLSNEKNSSERGEKDIFEILTEDQMVEYNLIVQNFRYNMDSIKDRVKSENLTREDAEIAIEGYYSVMNESIDNLLTEDQKNQLDEMKTERERKKEEFHLEMEQAKNQALELTDEQIASILTLESNLENLMVELRSQIESGELNREIAHDNIKSMKEDHRTSIQSLLNNVQIEIVRIHSFLRYHWKICAKNDDLIKEIIDEEDYELENDRSEFEEKTEG